MKITRLTKISIMLGAFFMIDKVFAIVRQIVIGRQFGLSSELDVFNVANNLPDLLFALISGGALAIAFIPVLSDVLTNEGRESAWKLFSRIANLAFVVTAVLSILIALFADLLVGWEYGIAPGFDLQQQSLVIKIMRIDLIATLIFSLSGLVMAGLQANQHFLLPALAPILYNIGQIFGAAVLAPTEGYQLLGFKLPSFGLGIYGLVYGVVIGAILHLCIQLPGLIKYKYKWIPGFGLRDVNVRKVVRLLGPRLITMFFIQLIFLVRDNLASRLSEGAVTALSYGWMIQQVPETLIGTAIGTALLPTISEQFSKKDEIAFRDTVERAIKVLLGITIPTSIILAVGLKPLIQIAFNFSVEGTNLLFMVTAGYLLGLAGHSLVEVNARSFYARQDALTPLAAAVLNVIIYILLGSILYKTLGAVGISITDSVAFTAEAIFLFVLLRKRITTCTIKVGSSFVRALIAGLLGGVISWFVFAQLENMGANLFIISFGSFIIGGIIAILIVWKEVKEIIHL